MKNILDKTNYNFIDKLPNSSEAMSSFLLDHLTKLEKGNKHSYYDQIILETKLILNEIELKKASNRLKIDKLFLDKINVQLNRNLITIKFYEKKLVIKDNEFFNFENHAKSIVRIKHKVVAEPFSETKALELKYSSSSSIRIMNRGNKPIYAVFYSDNQIVHELIAQPYKLIEIKHTDIGSKFNEMKLRNSNSNFILCLLEENVEL